MRSDVIVTTAPLSSEHGQELIHALDAELGAMYPEEGANHFDLAEDEVALGSGTFLIAYLGNEPVGCGAVRAISASEAEIKRMYVVPEARGRGISRTLLHALETEAQRLGRTRLVLETGERQTAALALYESAGFKRVPAFGEYIDSPLSVCMAKTLGRDATTALVRDATEADLLAITNLYNALIPTTTVTWTETPSTLEERRTWLEHQRRDGLPVLVADLEGKVVGFAAYEYFRGEGKWPGYRATMELSIHVGESYWGRGIGRALIEALVERARAAGVHVLVAAIDAENEASVRFHERLGFIEVARMPEIGQKFGRWLDLVLMQRVVDDRKMP